MSVGLARDHLKAQLSTVPVYAVANKKDEYVLMTPQVQDTPCKDEACVEYF